MTLINKIHTLDKLHKVFMTTALLVFCAVLSYQAQAQTCSVVVDNDADCGNNGCLTVTVAGGTSPFDYIWYDNLGNSFRNTKLSFFYKPKM